jgi:glycosyltransferase involved in cell wall biosynthesis
LHLEARNSPEVSTTVELVVPDSHDWTTLGTGGGVETFLKTLLQYASETALSVTVLCPGPRDATIGSIHFLPVMPHAPSELAFTRQLRRALTSGAIRLPKGAVVLANAEHYAWAFRGLDLPIVLMSHGVLTETLRMRHNAIYIRLFRLIVERHAVIHARRVIAVNSEIRDYYLSRYPTQNPHKFVEVPVGVDLRELEGRPRGTPLERISLDAGTPLVLFVGRLYPEKNLPLFIAACDNLKQRGDKFQALVIGDGVQAPLLQDAIATRPWMHWIPKMVRSEVLDTMALSQVLVICSRYEAGPLVLLEAIGLGTPVVSTGVGRARELVTPRMGRIVHGDPTSFAESIHEILSWTTQEVREASQEVRPRIDFRDTMRSLVGIMAAEALTPGDSAGPALP